MTSPSWVDGKGGVFALPIRPRPRSGKAALSKLL